MTNDKKLKPLEQFEGDVNIGDLIRFELEGGEFTGYFVRKDIDCREFSSIYPKPFITQSIRDNVLGRKIWGYEVLRKYENWK